MPDEIKPNNGSLFNFSISDLFGAGKGVEKLAATVGAGTGRMADGLGEIANVKWLDKERADNEAYRTEVVGDAQTRVLEKRAQVIAAMAREGLHLQSVAVTDTSISAQLAGRHPELEQLRQRAQQYASYENIMQQLNRDTVVAHAAVELAGDEQVSSEPVDPDWMKRVFRIVQDISNEEMQLIFGRILAGEVKQPGSFAPRTIDFLSTLTKSEANLFRELCAFAWNVVGSKDIDAIIFSTKAEGWNIKLPTYNELQQLAEIGLITFSVGIFTPTYNYHVKSITLSYHGSCIEIEAKPTNDDSKEPHIPAGIVMLTRVGKELARVCQPNSDPCILEHAIDYWIKAGCKVIRLPSVQKPADL